MLNYMSEITETLILLQHAGHAHYMKWQLSFHCSHYQTTDMQTLSKQMDNDLRMWKEHVISQRKRFYALNYFTAEQVLVLRKELKNASFVKPDVLQRELKNASPVKPDVLALLYSVSPYYQSRIQLALQTSQVNTSSQIVQKNATTSFLYGQKSSLVVQTDKEVDSKYLNLEVLGTALNGLPPGMYTNKNINIEIDIQYFAVSLEKKRTFPANLKAGFPNLLVVEPGECKSYK